MLTSVNINFNANKCLIQLASNMNVVCITYSVSVCLKWQNHSSYLFTSKGLAEIQFNQLLFIYLM